MKTGGMSRKLSNCLNAHHCFEILSSVQLATFIQPSSQVDHKYVQKPLEFHEKLDFLIFGYLLFGFTIVQ